MIVYPVTLSVTVYGRSGKPIRSIRVHCVTEEILHEMAGMFVDAALWAGGSVLFEEERE